MGGVEVSNQQYRMFSISSNSSNKPTRRFSRPGFVKSYSSQAGTLQFGWNIEVVKLDLAPLTPNLKHDYDRRTLWVHLRLLKSTQL
jgi:hypothetical protein